MSATAVLQQNPNPVGYSRHPHGKEVEAFAIEWLEDIATYEGIVGPRVFVISKLRQLMLANVDHDRLFGFFRIRASLRVGRGFTEHTG